MEIDNHIGQTLDTAALIAGYLNSSLDDKQQAELLKWINANEHNRKLFEKICNEANLENAYALFLLFDENAALDKVKSNAAFDTTHFNTRKKVVRIWPRIAVAASIIIAVFTGGYFYYQSKIDQNNPTIVNNNDVAPGKNAATLTLANGKKIYLNDALAGNIANESGVTITKDENGLIIYVISSERSDEKSVGNSISFNTLSTTNGETYQVRLPDGTAVWLNAASSITYPSSFAGMGKREVQLEGEAYFEVAKAYMSLRGTKQSLPFIVKTTKQQVEVLGTHFNINSYSGQGHTSTTLLEGSVRVSPIGGQDTQVLRPEQTAILSGNRLRVETADIEQTVAWKNGDFVFNGDELKTVMEQLARWYDIEVVYEGNLSHIGFVSTISRNKKLSEVLKVLQLTQGVHFKIEGRRVLVTP